MVIVLWNLRSSTLRWQSCGDWYAVKVGRRDNVVELLTRFLNERVGVPVSL